MIGVFILFKFRVKIVVILKVLMSSQSSFGIIALECINIKLNQHNSDFIK